MHNHQFCVASRFILSVASNQVGIKTRSVAATLMNQDSSRSHSIFTITIETLEGVTARVNLKLHIKKSSSRLNLT